MHALQVLGMGVNFDYEFNIRNGGYYQIPNAKLPGPVWLRALLGDDFFRTIIFVEFDGTNVTDTDLKHLEDLPQIRSLSLSKTQIADAGLENLKGLTRLQWLYLQNTQITDAGLEHLRNLTQVDAEFEVDPIPFLFPDEAMSPFLPIDEPVRPDIFAQDLNLLFEAFDAEWREVDRKSVV